MRLRTYWMGRSYEIRHARILQDVLRDPARRAAAIRILGPALPPTARGDEGDAALADAIARGDVAMRARRAPANPPYTGSPAASDGGEDATDVAVHWIEIELLDTADQPVAGELYEIRTPDERVIRGRTGADGRARVDGIENAGQCEVTFPNLDRDAWQPA